MSHHSKGTALGRHTSSVHIGAPPSDRLRDYVSTKVYFHGFADPQTENGKCVESPTFFCLGYEWCLQLYPRGNKKEDAECLTAYLVPRSSVAIQVEYYFSVEDENRGVITKKFDCPASWGALSSDMKWSLVIDVMIRPAHINAGWLQLQPSNNATKSYCWRRIGKTHERNGFLSYEKSYAGFMR